MQKSIQYRYLGANGATITTPVYLEGIYSVQMIELLADEGKILYNKRTGKTSNHILVPLNEEELWTEHTK